jgi:hypothetical protein
MNINDAKNVLAEKNIPFGIKHGLDEFYYTALTFATRQIANKAMKALKLDRGLFSLADLHMIKFYG